MNNDDNLLTLIECSSDESRNLITEIRNEIINAGIKANKNKLFEALSSICGELLEAATLGPLNELYRPMGAGDFTGLAIGYRPCKNAIDGLKALEYIHFTIGFCPASIHDPNPPKASRLRASSKLIRLASSHGIDAKNWKDHFKARPWTGVVAEPLIVREASQWRGSVLFGTSHKVRGGKMLFRPSDTTAAAIAHQVGEINLFLAGQDIQPGHWFRGLQRIYAEGDQPGFAWNKGGRLYAVGGLYQQQNGKDRGNITFAGEPSVEIDIKASHTTIYHALQGKPLSVPDPYLMPDVPRDIAKRFINMTLGNGGFHRGWPREHKADYKEDAATLGRPLQKDYPIAYVRKKVLDHMPVLADLDASPWRWSDFQFKESQAIIDTVHTLAMTHDVPALPVHDSIIVPVSKQEVAEKTLSDAFYKHVGVMPVLSVKSSASM